MKLHRFTALAVGAMLALPVWVHAAGLGKLTVKSALGQPFSAEIELLVADKAELDSLNASLASGQAYKDAQIEFAPVLSTLRFSIEKRANGRPVLRLTSSKPVNEPFMDMLIELNWASGRLLREYTVLLDPPGMAVPQTVAPVAVNVPETKPEQPAVGVVPKPTAANQFATEVVPAPAGQPAEEKAALAQRAAGQEPASLESKVRVKRGDTLTKIANRVRPASVSLEQSLVSLLHENPDAFIGNNMNRLKAGQSLRVPSAEAMAAIDAQAARREVSLQAADWQAYRAKLAERVAEQPAQEGEEKTVVGKITPKVEDKAQPKADAAKDVLKLSRAGSEQASAKLKAQAEQEDKAAREKALKESGQRAAELEKQILDMQKLAEMKEKEGASAPGAQNPPAAAAPKVEKPQANWYDELLENPIYWTGGAAVVVLGALLWWMLAGGRLRRKQAPQTLTDNIITGGGLQPSAVAGAAATGGVVNTGDTSFLTDFSQAGLAEIDTHDVDPIAEADVYMAYGRDAQAEEILKEALTKTPDRHEIRLKLLEIYAARKNVTAFESVAGELYAALGGQTGTIWDKAVEMGRSIDPHNPLYGGAAKAGQAAAAATGAVIAESAKADKAEPQPPAAETAEDVMEFASEPPTQELDFATPEAPRAEAPASAQKEEEQTLDFDLSGFDLKIPEEPAAPKTPKAAAVDFSGLDLDLDLSGDAGKGAEDEFDEAATKLDLARAYLEMGDKEGAREILQEVIAEGNDKQKSDAQSIMATL